MVATFAVPAYADTVAFLYALDADLETLKAGEPSNVRAINSGGTIIQEFPVGKHKVRATKMGAGNIETAINTANLLGRFPADVLISVGPCGALDDALPVKSWHRVDTVIGYQRGTFGAAGWVQAPSARVEVYPLPDAQKIAGASSQISLASGDAFVTNPAERERIRILSNSNAIDMNSFGLVLVCRQTRTPVMIWRIVSDHADATAGEDFKSFVKGYEGEGGRMVREFLLNMPASPLSPEKYDNIRELMR
jgi:adenosylhomocysteine nucleosidase